MDPMIIVREAIKAVPSVKYALAVAGVLATVSIGMRMISGDWHVAVIGIIGTIMLMTVLVIFARLSTAAHEIFHAPIMVLTWFSLGLLIVWATALTSSVFAGWPIKLPTILLDANTSECTVAPSVNTESIREKTAADVIAQLKKVPDFKKRTVFNNLFAKRYIQLGGWIGVVRGLPEFEGDVCGFLTQESSTGANIDVRACKSNCNLRDGDRIKLSGWIRDYSSDRIEIVANNVSEPHEDSPPPNPAPSPQETSVPDPRQVFIICHGEHEAVCKRNPYTVFEHCGDDNGVGGADGRISGRTLCGNDKFDVLPAQGGSIGGNHCGYSWFKIVCY